MAAYYNHGIGHLGSTRYREFLVFNIWVPWETVSLLYSTFGIHEIQGVSCIEHFGFMRYREFCCIVHLCSMRYKELLVLNILASWDGGNLLYCTFVFHEIQGVSCVEHFGFMRWREFVVLYIRVPWDKGISCIEHFGFMRYREFHVLNICAVWDKESISYWKFWTPWDMGSFLFWTFVFHEIQEVSCIEHLCFFEIQGVSWLAEELL